MHIAFFCPHSDPLAATGEPDSGGQCVYEAQVAGALAAQGHRLRAYTRHWGEKPPHLAIRDGAEVWRFPMGPEGFLRKEDMGPYLPQFTERVLAGQRDWLDRCDVVHGHYWDGGATALMAALALGKPLIYTSHSLGRLKRDRLPDPLVDQSTFHYPTRIAAETRVLASADGIIALSRVEKDALVERYGADPERTHIVPGGVDLGRFLVADDKKALQRQMGIDADYLLFTVGRLDARKGFVELIEAIPHVLDGLQEGGQRVCFLLPQGPENPSADERAYRQRMQERARNLGVEHAIRWFPRLSDEEMQRYYAAADLFLCPSPYEPFGLVVVEAFASGTPVVATCNGGPPEIVSEGVDGFLAEPSDAGELAGKILRFLGLGHDGQKKMGLAALQKAHEKYGWDAVAREIAKVYALVVEEHRQRIG